MRFVFALLVLAAPAVADPVFVQAWGTPGTGVGQLNHPHGFTLGSDGVLYVSDTANHRVDKFSTTGSALGSFGAQGSGNGQLNTPDGIAMGPNGQLYVCDTGNSRIQRFTTGGAFRGVFGSQGAGDGQFTLPVDVALDTAGNVYVADVLGDRILEFTATGAFVKVFAQVDGPAGLAFDNDGNLVVAEWTNQVQVFSPAGVALVTFGSGGSQPGQFFRPLDVAVDPAGKVYVLDKDNDRIQKFDVGATPARTTSWGRVRAGYRR